MIAEQLLYTFLINFIFTFVLMRLAKKNAREIEAFWSWLCASSILGIWISAIWLVWS